ncbi:MAG: MFS transporter [Woeseiaceae bacterium]|nr:MFS transporter [Woeseiaceae bacterium]NIP21137.1 MFS transporter [Woeseiaceae bacterium]NIS90109.1 MFS transporter [Woeseiaceae bacterium]
MRPRNLLGGTNGRLTAFGLLYISEGIPYGFTTTAMVAFMRAEGVSLTEIGAFVAALFIPWSFKWAWAPLIDLVKLHRLGGRKAWIVTCTSMMILTLLVVAAVDFHTNFQLLLAAVVLNNIFCATQDVAIDSLAVSTLKENERARGNGAMFGGQYLGIALGGGGAVFVYGLFGFDMALTYVSALLFLSLLFVVFFIQDPGVIKDPPRHAGDTLGKLRRELVSFFESLYASFLKSGRGPRIGLVFAVLPVGAMALAYATLGTIQVDYGLEQTEIAKVSIANTVAAAIGCLLGGWLGDRFGIRRMLGGFFLLTTVPTLILAAQISAVGLQQVPVEIFAGAIVLHGLFYGMTFGVHKAVFMGMTNPAVAATQFTAFMAMGNVAISYGNFWQGIVADRFDYAMVLYLDALVMLVPLAIIPFLRNREPEAALAIEASAA